MPEYVYAFEDLADGELPRPPLSAVRALRMAGVAVSPTGWAAIPAPLRHELALAGAADSVDLTAVRRVVDAAPARELRLIPKLGDPRADEVPPEIARALGPSGTITRELWRALRPLDRNVLAMLRANSRLFLRAIREMALRAPGAAPGLSSIAWSGVLAHAEVRMAPEVLHRLRTPEVLDGRACILSRVAGIRAARWASEILDLCAAEPVGPVEVSYSFPHHVPGLVVWQAHVSTTEGQFSPGGSLLAVATASAALAEIALRNAGQATIGGGRLAEETWRESDFDDDITIIGRY